MISALVLAWGSIDVGFLVVDFLDGDLLTLFFLKTGEVDLLGETELFLLTGETDLRVTLLGDFELAGLDFLLLEGETEALTGLLLLMEGDTDFLETTDFLTGL